LLASPAQAEDRQYDIIGAGLASDSNCPSTVTVFNQDDCSYDGTAPLTAQNYASVEWIGPLFNAGYYVPGTSPGPAIAGTIEPVPGDNKAPVPVSGTVTIEDQNTPADGVDDTIAGVLVLGAATRNFGAGARGQAEETWSSKTINFAATLVNSATANGNGGFDYVIGSRGYPQALVDLATQTDTWPSETGSDSDSSVTGSYWFEPSPIGIAPFELNVSIGTTATSVSTGYSCVDPQDGIGGEQSSCDAKGRLGDGVSSGAGAFENILLKLSTNGDGNITSAQLLWVQELDVVFPVNVADSWVAGIIDFTGTCANCLVAGVAEDDSYEVETGSAGNTLDIGANDTSFKTPSTVTISLVPDQGGQAVLQNSPGNPADVTVSYTPAPGFSGTEIFEYTVNDGITTDTARVSIVVASTGANDDLAVTSLNMPVTIAIGANDRDFQDPATATIAVNPNQGGTVDVQDSPGAPGGISVLYTPNALPGTPTYVETFRYTLADGILSDSATVTVTVRNSVPLAVDSSLSTGQGEAVTVNVAQLPGVNLGDAPSSITVTGAPAGGTTSVAGTRITYTPDALSAGPDPYQYTVTDRDGETSTATITVNVTASVPLPEPDFANTFQGQSVDIDVTKNDVRGTGTIDEHTVTISRPPSTGTVVVNGLIVSYSAPADSPNNDNFDYTLTDADGDVSAPVTVQVSIGPPRERQSAGGTSAFEPWSIVALLGLALGRRRRVLHRRRCGRPYII